MTRDELLKRYAAGERDFKGANLTGANLKGADLREADLSGADLSGADLRGADLEGAYFFRANLKGAHFFRADLRGANLKGTKLPTTPVVENLDSKILAAVSQRGSGLDMAVWHTCETTHCLAGWAVHLAGEEGYKLELAVGSAMAGTLIYRASTGFVPDFFATDEKALADLKSRAERSK